MGKATIGYVKKFRLLSIGYRIALALKDILALENRILLDKLL